MQRRTFLGTALASSIVPVLRSQPAPVWGGPVLDTHLHLRRDPDACFTHMQGCGVTNAVLLTRDADQDKAKEEEARRKGHFAHSVFADPTQAMTLPVLQGSTIASPQLTAAVMMKLSAPPSTARPSRSTATETSGTLLTMSDDR